MPRYYFDIRDSLGVHRDDIGDGTLTFDEARMQCQGLLHDVAREESPSGDLHTVSCSVRDETGRVVYRGRLIFEGTRDPA